MLLYSALVLTKKYFSFLFTLSIFFAIFLFSFFSFSSHAQAATNITDDITENTTWTLANSPYILQNYIFVWPGATLTVEPGVIVKINGQWNSINVRGSIVVNGTISSPVIFTSILDDFGGDTNGDGASFPSSGDWSGIDVNDPTSGSSFSNTHINYSNDGLTFLETPSVSILNLSVNYFNDDGLTLYSNSHATINGFSSDGGDDNIAIFNDSSGDFTNVAIKNSGRNEAISVFNDSSLSITDGSIKDGSGDGLFFANHSLVTLNNVTFDNFYRSAIIDFAYNFSTYLPSVLNISNSVIKNNFDGFEFWSQGTEVSVSNNSIIDNLDYGVLNHYSDTDYNFQNNFWGDSSGPYNEITNPDGLGDAVSENVLFDPWCKDETCKVLPTGFSNVLFLPGIETSRLYMPRANGTEDQLWEPNANSDVEALYLNTDGTSKNPNIYTRDIIKESNTPIPTGSTAPNVYKSFVDMLDDMVNNFTIADFKLFAYDWRQSVDDIVNNGTKYQDGKLSLVDTLQSLVNSSKNGKVTIIAHSNGGLLAKALLKKLQADKTAGVNNLIDDVDVLILVAVPEIGTAKAVPAILHGYDESILGGWLADDTHARELGRNMLGGYGLLPSREYINRVSASPVTFVDTVVPSGVSTKLVQAFGSAINSYDEYKSFLFGGEGRVNPLPAETNLPIILSQSLFAKAESLHNSIDTFVPPSSMRVIEVAGWGLPTVASFEYYPKIQVCSFGVACPPYKLDERPRFTSDGDKTVVVPSAQYMSANGSAEKYWVNLPRYNRFFNFTVDRSHASILEINSLNNLIKSVIKKEDIILDDVLKISIPVDDSNNIRLSIHSPVTLDAYDKNGNHTGKICPSTSDFCYIEENITNSSYLEFGEGKYLNLPEDQMFKVKLQGTGMGTFTYDSEKVLPNGTSATSSFVDIPVTIQTQAEITLNPTTNAPQLALDVTGDGVTDFSLAPKATFDPIIYLQIMKKTIDSLDLTKAQIKAFDNRVDIIIRSIQQGKIIQAKLQASKFTRIFQNTLSKPDPRRLQSHKLSKTEAQLLLDMLNKLLDNLS